MAATQKEKAGAPLIGNAIAYFIVVIVLVRNGMIEKADAVEAVAMGGAIVTYALLQVGAIFRFAAEIIRKRSAGKN